MAVASSVLSLVTMRSRALRPVASSRHHPDISTAARFQYRITHPGRGDDRQADGVEELGLEPESLLRETET